jgi:hypothetical protein
MFGNLLGTLQKFRQDENRVKESVQKKRQVEQKIEEKTEKEKEEAKRTKIELFSEKKKQQHEIRVLQVQMERVQQYEVWEKNKRREMQYIRTTVPDQPQVFFMPKEHNDKTTVAYDATVVAIEAEIAIAKSIFEEDLLKIEAKINNPDEFVDPLEEEDEEEEEANKPKSIIIAQPHKRENRPPPPAELRSAPAPSFQTRRKDSEDSTTNGVKKPVEEFKVVEKVKAVEEVIKVTIKNEKGLDKKKSDITKATNNKRRRAEDDKNSTNSSKKKKSKRESSSESESSSSEEDSSEESFDSSEDSDSSVDEKKVKIKKEKV